MAKQISACVGGAIKKVSKVPACIGGVVKDMNKGVCCIGGVIKTFFNKISVYLYNAGDLCTSLTNGWVFYESKNADKEGSNISVTGNTDGSKESDHLLMTMVSNQQNAIAMYVTSGKVSVADYSTLGVKVTITFGDNLIGGESYAHCKFGLFSNHYTESSYNVKIKYLKTENYLHGGNKRRK